MTETSVPMQKRRICPVCGNAPVTRNSPDGPRCGVCFAEEFPQLANPIENENKRLRRITQHREQMKVLVAQGMRQMAAQQTDPIKRSLFARAAIIAEGGDVLLYEDASEGVAQNVQRVPVEQHVDALIDTGLVTPAGERVMSDLGGELVIVHGGVE